MRTIRNENVCVVGGAGFLGSHLVNHLIEDRNCTVLVLDDLSSGRREFVNNKAKFEHCDITGSEHQLLKLFNEYGIQYVFNYAAVPYIPYSFERPCRVFDINAMGALKVINAAQEAGCKGILQVSSAEIYGNDKFDQTLPINKRTGYPEGWKISESAPVCPHSTYGAAKAAIDAMVRVRWKEAGTPAIAMRQFNCVGERETHPYVIPEIIQQIHTENIVWQDEPDHLHRTVQLGNNSFRDFQYAGDAVRMAVELLEKGKFGEVYNMGSEDGIQIYTLAKAIGRLMGCVVDVEVDQSRIRPWEIWHLQSDNTKLYSVIETRPVVSFEEALQRTINDFRAQGNKWSWQ